MSVFRIHPIFRNVVLLGLALPVFGLTGLARHQLRDRPRPALDGLTEVTLVPSGEVLRDMSLGYRTLAADLLFIRANLYYGRHIVGDEHMPWLSRFIDVLTTVDPHFKAAYFWGAMVTLYHKRQMAGIPAEVIHRANQILEKGMQRFPADHRFPMRIASNLYYELGDRDASLPYFVRAAGLPGAPRWLREKLVDLHTHEGQQQAAQQALRHLVMSTDDPTLNRELRDRLAFLLNDEDRRRLQRVRDELMIEWKREFGYLDLDLYLAIRDPGAQPDGEAP